MCVMGGWIIKGMVSAEQHTRVTGGVMWSKAVGAGIRGGQGEHGGHGQHVVGGECDICKLFNAQIYIQIVNDQ